MASLSTLSDIDLDKQVAALTRELASLKKAVAKRGGAYYEDGRDAAWDYYADLAERIGGSLPSIRLPSISRQGRAIEKTARDHPATAAVVGLVVLGLAASLFFGRR